MMSGVMRRVLSGILAGLLSVIGRVTADSTKITADSTRYTADNARF